MVSIRVTCPQSAELEEIDAHLTPLGMLVSSCSAFRHGCAMSCTRQCVAALERGGATGFTLRVRSLLHG